MSHIYIEYTKHLTSNIDNKLNKIVCKDVLHCNHSELSEISRKKTDR